MIAISEDVEPGTLAPGGSVKSNVCPVDVREDTMKQNQSSQVSMAKRDLESGVYSCDPLSCAQLLPSPRISFFK